ncbi:U4/U6 x U5 tri-snRNP complex subunit Prp1 [Polyrhizophydium stewartii]|uniref:U4/U6 x U5 tri-snRNP complex subunit Prp1 n=1 Tax=Polyrhizophydium stewartii TaxID=2732419 RepID=A0ABR4N6G9_9FUNG
MRHLPSMYQFKSLADPDFMSKPAPPNYIAGLGRGATGFTTRSDIGPARESALDDGSALAAARAAAEGRLAPAMGRGAGAGAGAGGEGGGQGAGGGGGDDDNNAERFQDPDQETGLFNTAPYEADDEEADRIYEAIDQKMDERRRARREAREQEELERYRRERPKIQQQFQDLKRGLSAMTEDEWAAIPEVGDLVRKKGKKVKQGPTERFAAVPDSVLLAAASSTQLATSIDASSRESAGTLTDFAQFGQARDKVLGLKLDQISDSVSGQTTIDPKGYLTDLSSVVIKSDAEISDIKKARMLLRSVTQTNPKHAPGWIAAARLEEVAGKLSAAREVIAEGCQQCPKSEDVWLESARLNNSENAKIILANAVRQIPQSVKIWLRARDLETDVKAQKRVLRRALEFIPNSVKIWKAAVSLEEDPQDARILLSRAVECVPLSVELWLALARLETYENARKVLNEARKSIPTSYEIWVTAAKLEEQNDNEKMVERVIERSITRLTEVGSNLEREQWITEAESCEKDGFVGVSAAIVRATIGLGLEEEELKDTWMEDAEGCIARGSIATARAILAHALKLYPNKKSLWRRAAFLEKEHGTRESLEELLQRAVRYCPQAEVLWLMGAKEKWLAGDIDGAKAILEQAFSANPNSEQIWLAAIKLEVETGQHQRARVLLASARERANTQRVWMKSAVLERHQGNFEAAMTLLNQALQRFPLFDKLWMIKGQIQRDDLKDAAAARETFAQGVKRLPNSISLWLLSSRLEEHAGLPVRARGLLERARILNQKQPELWCEAVRVEVRANNPPMAKALLAKALQECPASGLLWSEAILMEARPQRKARSIDALKKCENDPIVVATVARLFWAERRLDKARNWFNRAVKTNPDLGDTWAWWLKFETLHGTEQQAKDVIAKCVAAEPHHGEAWQREAKRMANVGRSIKEILEIVASQLENTL